MCLVEHRLGFQLKQRNPDFSNPLEPIAFKCQREGRYFPKSLSVDHVVGNLGA